MTQKPDFSRDTEGLDWAIYSRVKDAADVILSSSDVRNNHSIVNTRLEAGASPKNHLGEGHTLWTALKNDDLEMVEKLLAKGADANIPDYDGELPVFLAARLGHAACLEVLLTDGKTEVNVLNRHGCSALFDAITNKNLDCVSILLRYGIDPNLCQPSQGVHEGHVHHKGQKSLVRGVYGYGNYSPLMWAIDSGFPECIELLLSHGADPWSSNPFEQNSYQFAVGKDRAECLLVLLEHKTAERLFTSKHKNVLQEPKSPTVKGKKEQNTTINDLFVDSFNNHIYNKHSSGCAKLLVSLGADINYRNPKRLDLAVERLLIQRAKFLLEHNVDISSHTKRRRSLWDKVGLGCTEYIQLTDIGRYTEMKRLLLAAGCETICFQCPAEFEDFIDMWMDDSTLTLLQLCRKAIRNYLAETNPGNLFYKVQQLPIPPTIKKYLLYNESVVRKLKKTKRNIDQTNGHGKLLGHSMGNN